MERLRRMCDRIRVRGIIQRLLIGRNIRNQQSRKTFGHHFGGLLRLLLLHLGALDLLALRHVQLLIGREPWLDRSDHQDLIEAIEMRGRLHDDFDEAVLIGILDDLVDGADRKPTRKDFVAAGGQNAFAGLDAAVGREPDNLGLPSALPRRMPRMRVVSRITPAPLVWSLISRICADRG